MIISSTNQNVHCSSQDVENVGSIEIEQEGFINILKDLHDSKYILYNLKDLLQQIIYWLGD